MITIKNISKKLTTTGVHEYEVRVNNEIIATFKHRCENGIYECIRAASEAVAFADLKKNGWIEK